MTLTEYSLANCAWLGIWVPGGYSPGVDAGLEVVGDLAVPGCRYGHGWVSVRRVMTLAGGAGPVSVLARSRPGFARLRVGGFVVRSRCVRARALVTVPRCQRLRRHVDERHRQAVERRSPVHPLWDRPDMREILTRRDIAGLFDLLQRQGVSQR